MTCEIIGGPRGNVIICTRGRRRSDCSTPGCTNRADIQCDFAVTRAGAAGTCDRFICRRCAVHVGINKDYCPVHAKAAKP